MPLINTSVPNLIQGISQQPDSARYAGQCTEQENAMSSVLEGLVKRPPAEFLGKLFDYTGVTENEALDKAFIRFIDRDDQEKYVVIISSDNLRIFRIPDASTSQASEASIEFGGTTYTTGVPLSSVPYLASSFGNQDINSLTIGDTTILVNRTKTVAKGAAQTPARPKKAVVFVKQVDFKKQYKVNVDDNGTIVNGSYTTLDNTDSAHTKSSLIINDLATDLGNRGFALDSAHLGIHLAFENAKVTIDDDLSGDGLGIFYKEVNSISDLPVYCIDGMIVKIKGDAELNEDDYYVKFEVNEGENKSNAWVSSTSKHGNGSWVETAAPVIRDEITVNVPLVLRNTSSNTFELENMEFTDRVVGDDDTNPFPSFVGANIENVFLFKGRLGFLSQDAVIFSESGFGPLDGDKQTFNFFRTTVTTLLDSDPIDVRVSNKSVTNLRSAQPLQENLLIFSDVAQFKLNGTDLLTPKTVSITQVTSYESQISVEPLPLGSNLYFPFTKGKSTGLREYAVNPVTASHEAFDTTQHVPSYIPDGIVSCTGSDSEKIIALSTGSVDEGTVTPNVEFEPFEFAVVRYEWTSLGGVDLDTRTNISQPPISGVVGWDRDTQVGQYLTWGGDNTETGEESILIDFKKIDSDYPLEPLIKINLSAFWFEERNSGNFVLRFETYRGGTMTQNGYAFENSGGDLVQSEVLTRNVITQIDDDVDGELVGVIKYNPDTERASF